MVIPIKAYRYVWASKKLADWPEAFFQILERFEDTERVLEGVEIKIEVVEEGLVQLLVFSFCDEMTRRRTPVRVRLEYWDNELGMMAELEAVHSIAIPMNEDLGNRIFFARQIKPALVQAFSLVIEVEVKDEESVKTADGIGRLFRKIRRRRSKNLAM